MFITAQGFLRRIVLFFILTGLLSTALFAIGPLTTISVGHLPGPIVVNPITHTVYVVNRTDSTVSIINSESLTVEATVKVGTGPSFIAANPAANLVYVLSVSSGTITGISGTKVVGTLKIGGMPVAMAVDAALNQFYVADEARNQVEIFNATKGTLIATIPTVFHPAALAVNLATHAVFVACSGTTGSVVVIDGTHNQILTTVGSLPTGLTSISVDPVTNVAVTDSPSSNEYVTINAASGYSVVEEPGTSGADPFATAYDPGGSGLFLEADSGDGNIFFADGTGLILFGNAYMVDLLGAGALAVNASTNQMGVVYPEAQAAYIIDLINPIFNIVNHSLTTGVTPTALAFDPLTDRVFVTNAGDGTVSVFDITPETLAPAYEQDFSEFDLIYDAIDTNPATGTVYTLRLNYLFAINEAEAGAGANKSGENTAGVTAIPLASIYSEAVAVNSATNKIYVGDGGGLFYSVNGTTNVATLITSVPSSADIRSLAVDSASNQILAWDYEGRNVFVLDSATDSLLKTIPVNSSGPSSILVDPAKNLGYVASNSVFVFNPTAGTIVATIPLTGEQLAAALNPAASRLYVLVTGSLLYVIDTSKNSVVTTVTVPSNYTFESLAVNPVTGNYYVGMSSAGVAHVLIYSGATNTLISDLSGTVYPALTDAVDIAANPLTNTMYVGSDRGTTTSVVAVIDGVTGAVSARPPSGFDDAAHALAVDLGSGVLAGSGYSYTDLWFPTSDVSGLTAVQIAMAMQGVKDTSTIATAPIFRTHNTTPSFVVAATSNFSANASALVPKQAFCQVDGWQGIWTATALTPENNITSRGKLKLAALSTGRHILYCYASSGDIATIQGTGSGVNSPVISPVASVVFTVEQ